VFGIQFAPRHQVTADELVRVCAPGGVIALANWTPGGLIGRLLKIVGAHMPAPPAFASPPPLWGDEAHVRSLFPDADVRYETAENPWRFDSVEDFMTFFEERYGPMLKVRERLQAAGGGRPAARSCAPSTTRRTGRPTARSTPSPSTPSSP
jgi:hypothetical protein